MIILHLLQTVLLQTTDPSQEVENNSADDANGPPEGYYAFIESPNSDPPKVRPPPYSYSSLQCKDDEDNSPHASYYNLCGDLNKGYIPRNPMRQNVLGAPYPFELIKNHTLKFLSRTLPILKADETLPKVAQYQEDFLNDNTVVPYEVKNRVKRETSPAPLKEDDDREGKKFCDEGGFLCLLYKAINGELSPSSTSGSSPSSSQLPIERRDDVQLPHFEGPPTPCSAKVEYATPVFAKNYQGIWRYVVQIPYEGYFTQTVEVTRCLQSRCHYLEGGCLSSPRWSSLLVAEIYYPDTVLSGSDTINPQRSPVASSQPPSVQDFQNYQQYLQKRAGVQQMNNYPETTSTSKPIHCDGMDALGCFQVRLYYDWFLIPGSCKCWKPNYFNKNVRRKTGPTNNNDYNSH